MKIDRLFVVSLGAITGLASCSSGQEEEAQRPNILILLADDAGYAGAEDAVLFSDAGGRSYLYTISVCFCL